jgi:hypothetical protein
MICHKKNTCHRQVLFLYEVYGSGISLQMERDKVHMYKF